MARAAAREQLAFDETQIDDDDLEKALEERLRLQVIKSEVGKKYDAANEAANVEIAKQELPEGAAIRCGRFRITRSAVSARTVQFEAKATTRVRITLLDAEEADGAFADVDAGVEAAKIERAASGNVTQFPERQAADQPQA